MKTPMMIPAVLAGALSLGGCASTSDLDALRAELDAVRGTAEQASADAAAAKADAAAAQQTANAALSTANAAKRQSEETEAKIDRMFKKAMYK